MDKFLKFLISELVDNKKDVNITENEVNGTVNYLISVNKDDMGKIIGKEGKIINAIRNLVKILAVKENKRVIVNLNEP